jgi:Domain of unknown function (DUF4153)
MEETAQPSGKSTLPVILIAAVVEGWGLYGLHHAIEAHRWPATDPAWLTALYCVVIFGPLTVQLLASQVRDRFLWVIVGALSGILFYLGWHEGATQLPATRELGWFAGDFAFALPLGVLWLLMLPFLQGRLATGRWRTPYIVLFADAWRNKLVLAEATLFTGLFWLLLELWQALFAMLEIEFFRKLFEEPIFVYPVTAITFGLALHLIGSIERLTSVILEQLLNVLKWLALVAGSLLALFTVALMLRLSGLISSGQRAIGAVWLLWLVAVIVLLLNAAYRDGSEKRPYPGWIALALRLAVPLTVVISVAAIYALMIRTQHYGVTVERVWACIVAGIALLYSVGYSVAAFSRGPWMGRMARVNVAVAIVLMFVITLTLSPVLAPQRLAANSQFKLILSQPLRPIKDQDAWNSPFVYLRFQSGTYGLERLKQLATVTHHPDASDIRSLATAGLAMTQRWQGINNVNPDSLRKSIANLPIYPSGRTLEPALLDAVVARQAKLGGGLMSIPGSPDTRLGVFVDLDGDGVEEFLLFNAFSGFAFEHRAGEWIFVGNVSSHAGTHPWDGIRDALAKGEFSAVTPRWKAFSVGGREYQINEGN